MPGLSLIVNPVAGRGRALQFVPRAAAALRAAGVDHDVSESSSLEHACQLAAAAADAGRVVVAVGGDGMAGALAAAASRHGSRFGIIPAGRGNDLARVLGIPAEPVAAARLLAAGRTRQVDLIGVSVPGQPEIIVAGSVYLGVPSVAGEIANATRWLRGPAVYSVAALRAVARWQPATFALTTCATGPSGGPGPNGGPGASSGPGATDAGRRDFAGYAVVVANSAYFGAGMQIAPAARIDDAVLDLVLMRDGPKVAFIRALTKIKDGSHTTLDQVSLERVTDVTITIDRALPVAADGETLRFAAPLPAGTPLRIRVLPAALTVIAPR
jgi:diacylglycerol kinase (ATP)